jgi:hypothetical protein
MKKQVGSTVVRQLTHNPKFVDSNPADAASASRNENIQKKLKNKKVGKNENPRMINFSTFFSKIILIKFELC